MDEGMAECLSIFLISFKKKERWRWALQRRGRLKAWERGLWLAQPQSTTPRCHAGFHCDPKKMDLGTPPPYRGKTWLISGRSSFYSLAKAFDWDHWAFWDLATSVLVFCWISEEDSSFILHSMLWECHCAWRFTVKTAAVVNESHDLSLITCYPGNFITTP